MWIGQSGERLGHEVEYLPKKSLQNSTYFHSLLLLLLGPTLSSVKLINNGTAQRNTVHLCRPLTVQYPYVFVSWNSDPSQHPRALYLSPEGHLFSVKCLRMLFCTGQVDLVSPRSLHIKKYKSTTLKLVNLWLLTIICIVKHLLT